MLVPVALIVAIALLGLVFVIGYKVFKAVRSPAQPTVQKESRSTVAKNFRSMWNTHQDDFEVIATNLEKKINQRMLYAAEAEGKALRKQFDAFVKNIKDDQPGDAPASTGQTSSPPPPAPSAPALAARPVGEPIRSQPGA